MARAPDPSNDPAKLADAIRAAAHDAGFDICRFTAPRLPETVGERMNEAVRRGYHGTMEWFADRLAERSQPKTLWDGAKSVAVLGMSYGPGTNPLDRVKVTGLGNISVYAMGDDYHDVIKKRLKALGRQMAHDFGVDLKVFVDTAPVAEKPLAQAAGLGWQGKHTNLVSREHGSWLFLGVIYFGAALPEDPPETDHCGTCRACLDICPTGAFPAPYQLDARACISYLTIEHKGQIPERYRAAMGNRIYGCDDCLAVCPWNKFAGTAREQKLMARRDLKDAQLTDLAALDDAAFRALFSKNPVKRIGRDRFIRNVMIAIGNSGDLSLLETLRPRLNDDAPTVRAMAAWAWRRLGGEDAALVARLTAEEDPAVIAELKGIVA